MDALLESLDLGELGLDVGLHGVDSGGDPKHIPDLSFEQLKAFHARHYHPSNAKVFFYGDDDPDERLRLLDERLSEFNRIAVDGRVPLQSRFTAPKQLTRTYPAGAPEEQKGDRPRVVLPPGAVADQAAFDCGGHRDVVPSRRRTS